MPGQRDCTPNDGTRARSDCVGEDIENIIGSQFDDVLIGNDPDELEGKGPRWSPTASTTSRVGAAMT